MGRLEFETLHSLFDLVLHGYVLVASQYRGCCGGEGRDEFGGADHGLSQYEAEVRSLILDWCDRYVRDREPWPGKEPQGVR